MMDFSIHNKSHSYSIMLGKNKVYSFDLEGRPYWIFDKPYSYQRGLNNQLLLKWRDANQKYRSMCTENKKNQLYQQIQNDLHAVYKHTSASEKTILDKLLLWTPQQLTQNGKQFSTVYQPISILPPDQYTAIVVQAAIGCSYNRCSFCNFYKDRRFYIKDLSEFEAHLIQVKEFLGLGLAFRKNIFLADGDALMIPQQRLLKMMKLCQEHFPDRNFYSFMDAFRPHAKSLEDYRELQEANLKRVYIGLESGNLELLQFLNKPGTPQQMRDEVLKMKQAKLNVGVIIMLGAGGELFSSKHVKDTIEILNNMNLSKGDIIYFSAFVDHRDQDYHQKAKEAGIKAFSEAEILTQFRAIKGGLRFGESKPQASLYHLNEYIY